MEPAIFEIGAMMAMVTVATWACKTMLFGRGPIRRQVVPGLDELKLRVDELEERNEFLMAELDRRDDSRIAELEERLDFAERVLTRGDSYRHREADEIVREATPV